MERLVGVDLIKEIKTELSPYLQKSLMGMNNFEGFASERV